MLAFAAPSPLLRRPRGMATPALSARRPIHVAVRASAAPLLVVGAGVLGREVAAQWREAHPGSRVVAETRSTRAHEELAALGLEPALAGEGGAVFKRVVFCAPPSGNEDYPGAVEAAVERVAEGGVFVFTSSAGVYKPADAPVCEDGEVETEKPRAAKLLKAEAAVLARPEGRVVRLAGLYSLERGAHSYFIRAASAEDAKPLGGRAGSFVNLVHYEDAASMVVAVLERGARGGPEARRVFLATDCSPIMKEEICEAALLHPMYSGGKKPEFDESGPLVVKTYDNLISREDLGWQPKWDSYATFMRDDAAKRVAEAV